MWFRKKKVVADVIRIDDCSFVNCVAPEPPKGKPLRLHKGQFVVNMLTSDITSSIERVESVSGKFFVGVTVYSKFVSTPVGKITLRSFPDTRDMLVPKRFVNTLTKGK